MSKSKPVSRMVFAWYFLENSVPGSQLFHDATCCHHPPGGSSTASCQHLWLPHALNDALKARTFSCSWCQAEFVHHETSWIKNTYPPLKEIHKYRKLPFIVGKFTINRHVSMAIWNCQRVRGCYDPSPNLRWGCRHNLHIIAFTIRMMETVLYKKMQ